MFCKTSSITDLIRSSKSPLYFVPATIPVKSSDIILFEFKTSGASLLAIFSAKPSAIAVLPTPGSPIKQGLFLVLRQRICITRSISSLLPITGSSEPDFASAVRSLPYFSIVGVFLPLLLSVLDFGVCVPPSTSTPTVFISSLVSDAASTSNSPKNLIA